MKPIMSSAHRIALAAGAVVLAASTQLALTGTATAKPKLECSTHLSSKGQIAVAQGTFRYNNRSCGPTRWKKGSDYVVLAEGWFVEIKDVGSTCSTTDSAGDREVTRAKQILRCAPTSPARTNLADTTSR